MATARRKRIGRSSATRLEQIEEGSRAQLALTAVREEALNLQDQTIEDALSELSTGRLTAERAKEHFCKIAGLRRLIQGLEAKARIGQETMKRDIQNGTQE